MNNRAAVMPELQKIELQDVPYPTLGPRDVVVEVQAVGVCGSDTAYYKVGYIGNWVVEGPIILGHEVAGRVHETGPGVTRVKVGDRVAIEPGSPCRDCRDCMAGRYHLCPDLKFLATPPYDGALVQYLTMDERNLYPIPDSMSYEEGALVEPLSVGIWACKRACLEPGDDVLVTGAGPVGVLAAHTARALGAASVTLVDVSKFRMRLARDLGFDVEKSDAQTERQFDVLLECSGAPGVLAAGLHRLRTNGRAAMVGMPKQPVELPLSNLNEKELTIGLVHRYSHTLAHRDRSGRVGSGGRQVDRHAPVPPGPLRGRGDARRSGAGLDEGSDLSAARRHARVSRISAVRILSASCGGGRSVAG